MFYPVNPANPVQSYFIGSQRAGDTTPLRSERQVTGSALATLMGTSANRASSPGDRPSHPTIRLTPARRRSRERRAPARHPRPVQYPPGSAEPPLGPSPLIQLGLTQLKRYGLSSGLCPRVKQVSAGGWWHLPESRSGSASYAKIAVVRLHNTRHQSDAPACRAVLYVHRWLQAIVGE